MKTLAWLLQEHFDNHPDMEVRDAVKFLYQSYMGPGHAIADEQAALARLEEELAPLPAAPDEPLTEPLGGGLCRLNLRACKARGLSTLTLNRIFCLTAQIFSAAPERLETDLDLVRSLPFDPDEVSAYLAQYRAEGCPAVSHTDRYRAAYSPAYRVVLQHYADLLPILCAIDALLASQPRVRVALDGPCASGKSTLGEALAKIYRCPLFHMDDFFLRPEQRTPERLAAPGGNVDYERFRQEILAPLTMGEIVRYRPWQCRTGGFGGEVAVSPAPLAVVEGSYSLRPDLRDAYHLRLWVEAPWPVREERLKQRGGPGCVARFLQQWIPMEDRYFQAFQVRDCCHLTVSGAGSPNSI